MAGTKISALTAATSLAAADQFAVAQSGVTKSVTAALLRGYVVAANASTATVSAGYAVDTYLAGSLITVPAGAWKAGTSYQCMFDMTKTGAGTAAFGISLRIGTAGAIGDTAFIANSFAAGTAAVDTGIFTITMAFRSVGSGTAAVIAAIYECRHHLAATGLISTGASGIGILTNVSGGFDSTASTKVGLSINGGASFSGTNTFVNAYVMGL